MAEAGESLVDVLKHSVDRTSIGVPARAVWRGGWSVRRAAHRLMTSIGARMLYGRRAPDVPRMEYPPGHYHSPVPSAAEVEAFARAERPVPDDLAGIDLNRDAQLRLLDQFLPYYDAQPFTADGTSGTRYRFRNDFFPCADAIVLYCMLRHLRPRRVIEIGSGWSTCVTLDTCERFLDEPPELVLVEPYPERLLELVHEGDLERFTLDRMQLQDVPLARFECLQENDVLFVDSTHVTKVGSDVNHLLFEILPRVAPGVYVHIHDIQFPFEYTPRWIRDGRFWNEAYLVRAFLEYNATFEIALFVDYLRTQAHEHLRAHHPLLMEGGSVSGLDHGGAGSLWLRRVE